MSPVSTGAGRLSMDWLEAGRVWLAGLGLIGIGATLASALIGEPAQVRTTFGVALGVSALAVTFVSLWQAKIPASESWTVPETQGKLVLRMTQGDLFESAASDETTVLTMNRLYGLTTPDVVQGSLVRQLADRLGGISTLKSLSPGVFDRDVLLPTGSLQSVRIGGREYLLVAATSVVEGNRSASHLPLTDIVTSLAAIWRWARARGKSIRMPILGSGWSGSILAHEVIVALIALSLLGWQQEHPQLPRSLTVEVLFRRQDWSARSARGLRRFLRDVGFSRHSAPSNRS